jgi:hypothetical protein
MRVTLDNEAANAAIKNGTFGQTMQKIMEEVKPEASYFTTVDGFRGGYLIIDLKEPNEMIRAAEPFFLELNAMVELFPVMTGEEVMAGASFMENAAKKFG